MRVKVYMLVGGSVAPVILVGTLVLSEGRVVIENEDPGCAGTLANICGEPIRVWFEGQRYVWYSAQEQPEEFLRWLHRAIMPGPA